VKRYFELPEEFNVYGAQELLESLKLWLIHCELGLDDEIEIDAGKVMELDGTGLQILAALSRSGYRWSLVKASAKFVNACVLTGHQEWIPATEMTA
jgi:hypothetical protein